MTSPRRGRAARGAMSRPSRALPAQLPPAAAARALRRVARFVGRALPLCRAHTVEFFTRGLWQRLVAPPPDAVLEALRAAGPLARPLVAGSGAALLLMAFLEVSP
uniref:Uncharacterized protein n=1 Tax=Zonotrichia albicollis TaxID=44394 RepID=A0A8D2QF47_ZONAL